MTGAKIPLNANCVVRVEDAKTLQDLKDRLKCDHIYEVVSKLIQYYERLEILQHYLGCESIEHLFHEIEEMLPKSKKQLLVAKTNRYLDELRRLDVPQPVLNKLSETIFNVIMNGGRF
jgi:hypothetical protein